MLIPYAGFYFGCDPFSINQSMTDKPHNPMVNAGAIVVASLLRPIESPADKFDYVSLFD